MIKYIIIILIEYLIIYFITLPQLKWEVNKHEHWDCLELDPGPSPLIFFSHNSCDIQTASHVVVGLNERNLRHTWIVRQPTLLIWLPQVWASTEPDKMEVDDHSVELTSLHLDMHLWDLKQVEWRGSSSTDILHFKSDGDMVPYIGNRKRRMKRTLIFRHGGEKKKK